MVTTTVFNLSTYEEREYTTLPRAAVIAAYAQSRGDWNTWQYEEKYAAFVRAIRRERHITWACGDWTAIEKNPDFKRGIKPPKTARGSRRPRANPRRARRAGSS
jgi:hypothetical protein